MDWTKYSQSCFKDSLNWRKIVRAKSEPLYYKYRLLLIGNLNQIQQVVYIEKKPGRKQERTCCGWIGLIYPRCRKTLSGHTKLRSVNGLTTDRRIPLVCGFSLFPGISCNGQLVLFPSGTSARRENERTDRSTECWLASCATKFFLTGDAQYQR